MNKQVEELVALMQRAIRAHEARLKDIGGGQLTTEKYIIREECSRNKAIKQILSHPDLALIRRGVELPPILIDLIETYEQNTKQAQQDMLKWHKETIIPLAEALKEEK